MGIVMSLLQTIESFFASGDLDPVLRCLVYKSDLFGTDL